MSERIFSVHRHHWTIVPGPGCPLVRLAYIITSRLHFTGVNECSSLSPKEFMRSLYLLTLNPESSHTDWPSFRRDHAGYALKLFELSARLLTKVTRVWPHERSQTLNDSPTWPSAHFKSVISVGINGLFTYGYLFIISRYISHSTALKSSSHEWFYKDGPTSAQQYGLMRVFSNAKLAKKRPR